MKDFLDNRLFEGLNADDFEHLEKFIRVETYPAGAILMDEGQAGDALYLLGRGSVHVSRKSPEGRDIPLTTRHTGDFFGEMALIEDAPRSAKVITAEACRVGLISKTDFNAMWHHQPQIALNIIKTISARLRQSNDQTVQHFLEREQMQARQLERLRALFDFSKLVALREHDKTLFYLVPDLVHRHVPCRAAMLFVREENDGRFYTESRTDHVDTRCVVESETSERISAMPSSDYADPELAARLRNLVPAIQEGPLWIEGLFYESEWLGFLLFEHEAWNEEDQTFIQTLASYLAVVLRNIQLTNRMVDDEKMSAIGRASSSFMHDCKNLIAIVHLYAQMISRTSDKKEMDDMIAEIVRSANLIMAMSREVLFYANGEIRVNREVLNVRRLIETALALAKDDMQKREIGVTLHVPDHLSYAFDQDKMIRVLYNLILNACQASGPGGGRLHIEAIREAHDLIILIRDNGPGIPREIMARMFTPFATTRQDGTGLGLAIVKSIVEAHDGEVTVENRPDGGAQFELSFPL